MDSNQQIRKPFKRCVVLKVTFLSFIEITKKLNHALKSLKFKQNGCIHLRWIPNYGIIQIYLMTLKPTQQNILS